MMPIYEYECPDCKKSFEQILRMVNCDMEVWCLWCGAVSKKVPAMFATNIFQQRSFVDGTKTPDHVNTPKQEKAWLRSEGISYDTYSRPNDVKIYNDKIKEEKSKIAMKKAFKQAINKVEQGFVIHNPESKTPKSLNFAV